jgi:hypothetical protein
VAILMLGLVISHLLMPATLLMTTLSLLMSMACQEFVFWKDKYNENPIN